MLKQADVTKSECEWARREELLLAPYAMHAKHTAGRTHAEAVHPYRSPYQRDRDRILHSAAFRRLSGKMQVFTGDMGDYHRTRLTHTHEVATIARTIGRTLRLNEDLVEALALLHDIGHPPYGHSGEDALNACMAECGGFSHNQFALVLAEQLESRYTAYPGLNLSAEVLAGQTFRITHAGLPPILEVQVVDLADSIAYNAHDVDDALAVGLLDLPQLSSLDLVKRATRWRSEGPATSATSQRQLLVYSLIDTQVSDVLESATDKLRPLEEMDHLGVQELDTILGFSPAVEGERDELARFLFDNVYRHPKLLEVRQQAAQRVERLYGHFNDAPSDLPRRFQDHAQSVGLQQAIGHYIAGMTDRFCDAQYARLIDATVSPAHPSAGSNEEWE